MRIISQENQDALVQLDLLSFFSAAVLSKGMIMNELSRPAINREPRLLRAVGRHEQILARFGRVFRHPSSPPHHIHELPQHNINCYLE